MIRSKKFNFNLIIVFNMGTIFIFFYLFLTYLLKPIFPLPPFNLWNLKNIVPCTFIEILIQYGMDPGICIFFKVLYSF